MKYFLRQTNNTFSLILHVTKIILKAEKQTKINPLTEKLTITN